MSDDIPEALLPFHQRKLEAEAAKLNAEAEQARLYIERTSIDVRRNLRSEELELAADWHHGRYRFAADVTEHSVEHALTSLGAFTRVHPGEPIEFVINSGGGYIVEGMELFDYLLHLRDRGHEVTTIATGMAASMAGILLQAGTWRVMTRNAQVLIHEAKFGAGGSVGQVKDVIKRIDKISERILAIFAERSAAACAARPDVHTQPLTLAEIRAGWDRQDWWLNSDECLAHGFVDEVR